MKRPLTSRPELDNEQFKRARRCPDEPSDEFEILDEMSASVEGDNDDDDPVPPTPTSPTEHKVKPSNVMKTIPLIDVDVNEDGTDADPRKMVWQDGQMVLEFLPPTSLQLSTFSLGQYTFVTKELAEISAKYDGKVKWGDFVANVELASAKKRRVLSVLFHKLDKRNEALLNDLNAIKSKRATFYNIQVKATLKNWSRWTKFALAHERFDFHI